MARLLLGRLLHKVRAGEAKLAWNRVDLQAQETIVLTSDAFVDGGNMPLRTADEGVDGNISPELSWTGVADGAAEIVLLVEDPDAPLRSPFVHLAIAGIPASVSTIGEGGLNAGALPYGYGSGSFRRRGYAGPRPVRGHGPHKYVFQIYSLSEPLAVEPGASPRTIVKKMAGKVASRGQLVGLYQR